MLSYTRSSYSIPLIAFIFALLLNLALLLYFLCTHLDMQYTQTVLETSTPEASVIMLPEEEKEEWAATYAQQSTFGLPQEIEIPESEELKELESQETDQEKKEVHPEEKIIETPASEQEQSLITELSRLEGAPIPVHKPTPAPKKVTQPLNKKKQVAQKKPEKVTLAQLTNGFLESMKYNGSSRITMLGKEGALPSDKQLQHERYLEKIQWCLNNSFEIHRSKLPGMIQNNVSLELFMALNADGSMRTLTLRKSCGNQSVDQFVLFIFNDASSSFPPVPSYLPHNPYSISYRVEIGSWVNSPVRIFR